MAIPGYARPDFVPNDLLVAGCAGRFDPVLVNAFQTIEEELDAIFRTHPAESRATAVFA